MIKCCYSLSGIKPSTFQRENGEYMWNDVLNVGFCFDYFDHVIDEWFMFLRILFLFYSILFIRWLQNTECWTAFITFIFNTMFNYFLIINNQNKLLKSPYRPNEIVLWLNSFCSILPTKANYCYNTRWLFSWIDNYIGQSRNGETGENRSSSTCWNNYVIRFLFFVPVEPR